MRAYMDALLWRFLPRRPSIRILDAGCGTGMTMIHLQQYTSPDHVVGLEIAHPALQFCRQRSIPLLVQGTVTDLPFPAERFDLVVCTDVLQHLPDDAVAFQALQEFQRVLRPGGILFLRTRAATAPEPAPGPHTPSPAWFTRRGMAHRLTAGGWQVRLVTYANMVPAWLSQWHGRWRTAGRHHHALVQTHRPLLRMPPPRINRLLRWILSIEARYVGITGRPLPYGHSLICIAQRPS